jgi:arylsulfatase A-like enzyme
VTRLRAAAPAALLALLLAGCEKTPEGPNVLLITLDTLRADHLGCYGYMRPTSPVIDALAEEATRYTRTWATSPWTVPTHASMFTGKFPFEHGAVTVPVAEDAVNNVASLPLHHLTLAEALRDEGYRTGAIVTNEAYLPARYRLDQGFETYSVRYLRAPFLNRFAFQWLEEHGHRPFFLFLNYMETHRPYSIRIRPDSPFRPSPEPPGPLLDKLYAAVMGSDDPIPERLVERIKTQYDNAVFNVDGALGELFDHLREKGLWEQTLIVVTSDHGEYFGEHRLVEHSKDVYEEALRAPLLIRAPGQTQGEIVDTPVSSVDLPRLILAHLPPAIAAEYEDDFPYVPGSHPVLAENRYTRLRDLRHPVWGARFRRVRTVLYDPPWKYIRSSDGNHELYHLELDPHESRNLTTISPDIATRLAGALAAFEASRPAEREVHLETLSPADRERLGRLGYIEVEP